MQLLMSKQTERKKKQQQWRKGKKPWCGLTFFRCYSYDIYHRDVFGRNRNVAIWLEKDVKNEANKKIEIARFDVETSEEIR